MPGQAGSARVRAGVPADHAAGATAHLAGAGALLLAAALLAGDGRPATAPRPLRQTAGDANLAGGDELDVDPGLEQGAEHARRVARRVLHPGTDDADLAQLRIGNQ